MARPDKAAKRAQKSGTRDAADASKPQPPARGAGREVVASATADLNGEFHLADVPAGNYVLVASLEKALIEITPAGEVVLVRPLPKAHEQAEGVAITKDSILIVSDEAKQGPAVITLYKWPSR